MAQDPTKDLSQDPSIEAAIAATDAEALSDPSVIESGGATPSEDEPRFSQEEIARAVASAQAPPDEGMDETQLRESLVDAHGMSEEEAEAFIQADQERARQDEDLRSEPVLQHTDESRVEGQARLVFDKYGAGVEDLTEEERAVYDEKLEGVKKTVDPSVAEAEEMRRMGMSEEDILAFQQQEKKQALEASAFAPTSNEDMRRYTWEKDIELDMTPSPHGYLERVLGNEEHQRKLFNKLGRVKNLSEFVSGIIGDNYAKAFADGRDFDGEKATANFLAKLYIDIAHKLGKDTSNMDYQNADFREFVQTGEGMEEIQNGLGLIRGLKTGRIQRREGETERDMFKRVSAFGVFDGSGQPSQYRSGISKEEWDEQSVLRKIFFGGYLRDVGGFAAHRFGKATGIQLFDPKSPRHTTTGGQIVGTIAPYLVAALAAYRTGQAKTGNRAIASLYAEVAGVAADMVLEAPGEENLANMIDDWSDGGAWSEVIGGLAHTEDQTEWTRRLKAAGEGAVMGAAIGGLIMAAKYGFKAGAKFIEEVTGDAPTTKMGKWLRRAEIRAHEQNVEGFTKLFSGLGDVDSLWEALSALRRLKGSSKGKPLKEAEEQLQAQFDEAVKDMSPEEVAHIKRAKGEEAVGEAAEGKRWRDMGSAERQDYLQERSQVYRDARAWLDSVMMKMDLEERIPKLEADGIETTAERDLLRRANISIAERSKRVSALYDIDMADWKFQKKHGDSKENLEQFLRRNDLDPNLSGDELKAVREARERLDKAKKDKDKLWGGIEDEKMRERIRLKVEVGGKLTKEEKEALGEAQGLATTDKLQVLEDELESMRRGELSESDRELFKHAKRFKGWMDGLEDGELKQGILDAVAAGRGLSESQAKALQDAGLMDSFDKLKRRGLLGVDSDEAIDVLDQLDEINTKIEVETRKIETKRAKSAEAAEKKVQAAAVKLDNLERELDEVSSAKMSPEEIARREQAKEGLEEANKDLEDLRAKLKDTPKAELKAAEAKVVAAEKRVAKAKEKLARESRPLTREQKARKAAAEKELDSAKAEVKDINKRIGETEPGKLKKAEQGAVRAQRRVDNLYEKLAKSGRQLTPEEEAEKLAAEQALEVAKEEAKAVRKLLEETPEGKFKKMLKDRDAIQKRLEKSHAELKEAQKNKLSFQQKREQKKAVAAIEEADAEIKASKEAMKETATGKLSNLQKAVTSATKRVARWKKKVADGEKLTPSQEKLKKTSEQKLAKLEKQIAAEKKKMSETAGGRLKDLEAKVKRAEKRKAAAEEAVARGSRTDAQDELEQTQAIYDDLRAATKDLEGDEATRHSRTLAGVKDTLDRVRREQEAFDEATGALDDWRTVTGELYYALKAYNRPARKTPELVARVEQAFYNLQKFRVGGSYEGVVKIDSQAAKITRNYIVPGKTAALDTPDKFRDFSRNNSDNGAWRGNDIVELLNDFNSHGKTWANKEVAEDFMNFMDNHSYFKRGSILRPAFSKFGLPVWLQGARMARVASYVTGLGTQGLAISFGVAATVSRAGFRKGVSILGGIAGKEIATYNRLLREVTEGSSEKPGAWWRRMTAPQGGSRRNPLQTLLSPARNTFDHTGDNIGSEFVGEMSGMGGRELSHFGRSMEGASMTTLAVRAQNIENPVAREIATAMVGAAEAIPREMMGTIDRWIKAATFDSTLKESVVDTLWRATDGNVDVKQAISIVNALRRLEDEVVQGKVAPNEVRTWLAEELDVDDFSDPVRLAVTAREQAWELQRELTLQQRVSDRLRWIQDLSRNPASGHFFMFGKTVANTTSMTAERIPVAGYFIEKSRGRLHTPKGKIDTWAKQSVGLSLIGGGAAISAFASDRVTLDKHGNMVVTYTPTREEMKESLDMILEQTPGRLASMMEMYNKTHSDQYDFSDPSAQDRFINDHILPEDSEGKLTLERHGSAWALFTLGVRAHWLFTNRAQHLPKAALDEMSFMERFADAIAVLTDVYGVGDIASSFDDVMTMIENPQDAGAMMALLLSDTITPWKGLLYSPGEPLYQGEGVRTNNRVMELGTALTPRYFRNIKSEVTMRDGLFMSMASGKRFATQANVEFYTTDFERDMDKLNIRFDQYHPRRMPKMGGIDTYQFRVEAEVKDGEVTVDGKVVAEGVTYRENQSVFDYLQQRAGNIEVDGETIDAAYKSLAIDLESEYKMVEKGLNIMRTGYDVDNPKHVVAVQASIDAQTNIKKQVNDLRTAYLGGAIEEFMESDAVNQFTSPEGDTIASYHEMLGNLKEEAGELREEAMMGAETSAKADASIEALRNM